MQKNDPNTLLTSKAIQEDQMKDNYYSGTDLGMSK
jgi:hypothetical protein